MKRFIIMVVVLFMTTANASGKFYSTPEIICIDGVQYIIVRERAFSRAYGYMSVKFNKDGKVVLCNNGDKVK